VYNWVEQGFNHHQSLLRTSIDEGHISQHVTHEVLQWVVGRLSSGHRVATATVIDATGSVPGKPGARLAISSGAAMQGTIGGAGLELQVIERLEELLRSANGRIGAVETFQLAKEALGKEPKNQQTTALDSLCGGRVTVAMEVVCPMPHILLCGGGHVAQAIAAQCGVLGWEHSVFDVRTEYSDKESHPHARERFCSTAAAFLATENAACISRFSDILLLGHDWAVDEELLLGLLTIEQGRSDYNAGDFDIAAAGPRIGVISSRSKWKRFSASALKAGIQQELLERVDAPIGLDIGADSPAEIAVAVTAQLIARMKHQDLNVS
jgi:xanthine dehydrogenase accessory factor